MVRDIEEVERKLVTIEIGRLVLHNFTLQMPIQDIAINRVIAVNQSLKLSECSSFALNSLFAFFLKQGHQIEEFSFVQSIMDPSYNLVGDRIVNLGCPKSLKISKTQLPFQPEAGESTEEVMGLDLRLCEKLVLTDLVL